MQAETSTISVPPALRRGTITATQRVVAALRGQGFDAHMSRDEWDGASVCLVMIEALDGVTINAHCSEDEPDSDWRVIGAVPGAELADVQLRNLRRSSSASQVMRALVPYLSMTREEWIAIG